LEHEGKKERGERKGERKEAGKVQGRPPHLPRPCPEDEGALYSAIIEQPV
jgi:hypothetical protein